MKQTYRKFAFKTDAAVLALSLIMVCLTGHAGFNNTYPWIDSLIDLCKYALYALLVLDILRNGATITQDFFVFVLLTAIGTLLNVAYNTFASKLHFDVVASVRQVIFYILFVYTGFYIAQKNKKSNRLFRWLKKVAVAASIIIFIQYFLHYFGIYLNRIPGIGNFLFHAVDNNNYFRPSAFFSEPSYAAEVLVLDLYANLFLRRNLRLATIEILALLISTSSLGIVFGGALVVWWIITQKTFRNRIINILTKVVSGISFLFLLIFLFGYSGDNKIILRLMSGATIRQRTFRAFELYGKMEPAERIFGIGMQNLTRYLQTYDVTLINEGIDTLKNQEFAQSFGYILCTLGIIGALGFCFLFVRAFQKIPTKRKIIVVIIFGMSMTCSLITRQIFCIMIAVMYSVCDFLDTNSDS